MKRGPQLLALIAWLVLSLAPCLMAHVALGQGVSGAPDVVAAPDFGGNFGKGLPSTLVEEAGRDGIQNPQAQILPALLSSTVRMVVVLSIMVAGLLFAFYFIKPLLVRAGAAGGREKVIQILENKYMGGKKVISVVRVADQCLVIGLTPNNITLLANIEDQETIEKLRPSQGLTYKAPSFISQFKKFSSRFVREEAKLKDKDDVS